MAEFNIVFMVVVYFMIRIDIPLLLLVTLGTLVDRWQRKHSESWLAEKQRKAA